MSEIYKTLYVEVFKQTSKKQAIANASGVASVAFESVRQGYFNFVERVAIIADPNNAGTATNTWIFAKDNPGGVDYSDTADYTALLAVQQAAVADMHQPIFLTEGETLKVRVEGLNANDIIYVNAQVSIRVPVRIMLPDVIDLDREEHRQLIGAFTS